MRILILAAHSSGLAKRIADALRERGHDVVVEPTDSDAIDALCVGMTGDDSLPEAAARLIGEGKRYALFSSTGFWRDHFTDPEAPSYLRRAPSGAILQLIAEAAKTLVSLTDHRLAAKWCPDGKITTDLNELVAAFDNAQAAA